AAPHMLKLIDQLSKRRGVKARRFYPIVLLKSRQRCRVKAREKQRPQPEDALGVGHVADDFLDAPFARRVTPRARVGGKRPQKSQRRLGLRLHRRAEIIFGHQADVAAIVFGMLGWLWPTNE